MYYPDVSEFLCANLPGYSSERRDTQRLIDKILFLPTRHYKDSEDSCLSISVDFIRSMGHSEASFNRVNSQYEFYTIDRSYRKGVSRKAYPNPIVSELLCKYSLQKEDVDVWHLETDRKIPRAFLATYSEGATVNVGGLNVEAAIRVDEEALIDYIQKGECTPLIIDQAIKYLRMCHTNQFPTGVIPQAYRQIHNGRVVGQGLPLQNCKKSLRTALMNGYYDYDFTCCHYAILAQESGSVFLQEYVDHTQEIREAIAGDLDVDIKSIKRCLLSIIYGAGRGKHPVRSAIASYIGPDNVDDFWDHTIVKTLHREVQTAGEALLGNTPIKESFHQDLANKLMGLEHNILKHTTPTPHAISVPMYDGFISKHDYNLEELETSVKESTGYNITIKKESINYEFSRCKQDRQNW